MRLKDLAALKHEEWRDVRGYEGRYQVSSLGRVRSLLRGGRVLCLGADTRGRPMVMLSDGGRRYFVLVHRLVAKAFIPKRDGERGCRKADCVVRLDGSVDNVRRNNLAWRSMSEVAASRHNTNLRPVVLIDSESFNEHRFQSEKKAAVWANTSKQNVFWCLICPKRRLRGRYFVRYAQSGKESA